MQFARLLRVLFALALVLVPATATPGYAATSAVTGGMPSADCLAYEASAAPPSAEVAALLETMPLEVKVGQMLMAGVNETAVSEQLQHFIAGLHVGNVVLMGDAVDEPQQVVELTQDLQQLALEANGVGLLVSTDQEGGLVQRLRWEFTRLPEARTIGSSQDPELIRHYGQLVGEELLTVGVNMNLAPVLDVNDNPANPVIGNRAFGTTPEAVILAGNAFIQGLHDAGVIATGKHFPGHGNTSTDSHLTLPYVEKSRDELEAVELAPFRSAIEQGLDVVMLAHVVYPALDPSGVPATVSESIVGCLLRGELGFDGVVITDDMGMKGISDYYSPEDAAVATVLAGTDLILCSAGNSPEGCTPETLERMRNGLLQGVADGRIAMERIDRSVQRILTLKERYQVGPVSGEGLETLAGARHLRILADVMEAAGRP